MRRLLVIGDAGCPSGFARVTHKLCDYLDYRSNPSNPSPWEVSVLGLNYRGLPDVRRLYPYDIYPAAVAKRDDLRGHDVLPGLLQDLRPDVVVIQNDPWNVPRYMEQCVNVPTIAMLAVDGLNCKGRALNGLHCAVFWTQFGAEQAIKGGYQGPFAVVGLGVDQEIYKPIDRHTARKRFFQSKDYPDLKDVFIVGNVNRNQPRKRFDLTISYFAEWVRTRKVNDAYLALHVAPTGDVGVDCHQLMTYYGLANRLILSAPEVWKGIPEEDLNNNYNIFDVGFTTTQGEGWGLTTMEMMACGIPQIVPDWAALGEWPKDTVVKVPCTEIACTLNEINVIGGIMDRKLAIEALDKLYREPNLRSDYGQRGRERVSSPEFRWSTIGQKFNEVNDASLDVLGVSIIKSS